MKCKICILFLAIIISFPVHAQKAKITGVVTDENNNPIELAIVQEKGSLNGTLTNEKGQYSLTVNAKDSCSLIFSCLGFMTTQRVIPSVEGDLFLSVRMKFKSVDLAGVEVRAIRRQTTTTETLDPSKIRLLADPAGGSIESLIVTFAGVSAANELSSQYSVRGGSYDENIVYVNGIEVYRPLLIRSGQQEGLSFINPDLTESVHFSSGGFEARYGDKMSSVLDIAYKKPSEFEASVSGSLLGGSGYVGSTSGKFTQITGFRYKKGTSLLKTLDTTGDYDPSFIDLQTYLNYDFSRKLSLSFLGNLVQNNYNFTPTTRSTSFGTSEDAKNFQVYFDGMEKDAFRTLFGAVSLNYKLFENTTLGLQLSGFQSLEQENYDILGEYILTEALPGDDDSPSEVIGTGKYHEHARNHLNAKIYTISHVGKHNFEFNTLQWSLGYQREIIDDNIREYERRDSLGYSIPYTGDRVNVYKSLYSDNSLSTNRFNGYIQDTYKFRIEEGLLSLTAGIRGSYWDFNNEFVVSPRASVGYIPSRNQNFTFRFATGLYYQTPFYKEFRMEEKDEEGNSVMVLNKDIKSQRSIHFVLGGDYNFYMLDRPFKFTAEMYYKNLSNLVPYTVDNVKIRYYGYNCAKGYTTGIDLKLFGEFVEETDSWLSFSLMKAEQNIGGIKVPLPTDQRYNISLYFTDFLPKNDRIQMNLKAIWSDGVPFAPPGGGYESGYFRSKSYRRVDIGMSYLALGENYVSPDSRLGKIFKNIWVGVDVFNLLDIKNVSSYYWASTVDGSSYSVPNYLTGRQLNFRLIADF